MSTALNSEHLTALENVGTGILYSKWWRLEIPFPTWIAVLHNTQLHREFASPLPPSQDHGEDKNTPLHINCGHADPL